MQKVFLTLFLIIMNLKASDFIKDAFLSSKTNFQIIDSIKENLMLNFDYQIHNKETLTGLMKELMTFSKNKLPYKEFNLELELNKKLIQFNNDIHLNQKDQFNRNLKNIFKQHLIHKYRNNELENNDYETIIKESVEQYLNSKSKHLDLYLDSDELIKIYGDLIKIHKNSFKLLEEYIQDQENTAYDYLNELLNKRGSFEDQIVLGRINILIASLLDLSTENELPKILQNFVQAKVYKLLDQKLKMKVLDSVFKFLSQIIETEQYRRMILITFMNYFYPDYKPNLKLNNIHTKVVNTLYQDNQMNFFRSPNNSEENNTVVRAKTILFLKYLLPDVDIHFGEFSVMILENFVFLSEADLNSLELFEKFKLDFEMGYNFEENIRFVEASFEALLNFCVDIKMNVCSEEEVGSCENSYFSFLNYRLALGINIKTDFTEIIDKYFLYLCVNLINHRIDFLRTYDLNFYEKQEVDMFDELPADLSKQMTQLWNKFLIDNSLAQPFYFQYLYGQSLSSDEMTKYLSEESIIHHRFKKLIL